MEPIIELDRVSFTYADAGVCCLRDITLAIDEGTFVGIIGPSGAGKTTLTHVCSGAVPHHFSGKFFGAARVAGMDTCTVSLTDIARVVGSVLQDIDAQMVASVVEDELLFGLENFGVEHDQIEARISGALDAIGIADLRQREIATLSGGQKQKVAIAAILALEPRVLILDEPTAALDPVSARMVFEVLRSINQTRGITVVIVEQAVALLSEFCDRVIVLDQGTVALDGTPHEVFAHAEQLRRIGVDVPRTARISNSLVTAGLIPTCEPCLNVDEAYALVSSLINPQESGARTSNVHQPIDDERGRSPHAPRVELNASPVVEVRNVSFSYANGGAAVHDLELHVAPGEIVGIVGQNGAGKTTLTKLLNGLLKPERGTVAIAGNDTNTTPVSTIARHAATLFQNPDRQLCRNTVLEEVAFGLELQGVSSTEAQRRAQAVIERFGLPANEAPFSLSRGQRQMVALASVVVMEPQVVILDEPTSGLDYRECMTVMETVRDMAQKGSAVVLVCHDMEVVSDFAQRVVVMAQGRILGTMPTHEAFRNTQLMEAAHIAPPQVIALSERLSRGVSPTFAGIAEVSHLVGHVMELVRHE